MTEAFYVAVKGSLHSSDSAVFGLSDEEVAALSKRFGNIKKEVINGILIKANPLEVINSLSELGYRVACSSGEAEMVWTLRREVLGSCSSGINQTKTSRLSKFEDFEVGRKSKDRIIPTFKKPDVKRPESDIEEVVVPVVQRLGTKPEDMEEFGYDGSRILVVEPEDIGNIPEDKKIIIKSNLSSEENPLVSPWGCDESNVTDDFNSDDRRSDVERRTLPPVCAQVYVAPEIECNMSCTRNPPVPSVHQTMEEMDFERGLWYPALMGDLPRLKLLLRKGHNPNEEDNNGYTALHYGARCGFPSICTALLEAGANVNKTTRAGGASPLHRAALAGNDDIIMVLIRYGANLLAKDADGRTPLHRAVEANHPTSVAILLNAAPESNSIKDRAGRTARHYVKPDDKVMGELFESVQDSSNFKSSVGARRSTATSTTIRKKSPLSKREHHSSKKLSPNVSVSKKTDDTAERDLPVENEEPNLETKNKPDDNE